MFKRLLAKISIFFVIVQMFHASALALPERLVTLAPNLAEWVAEIAGKEDTLKNLVGVSEYSMYPAYVDSIESVGPYPHVNIEKILKLKPTLIIALSDSNDEEQLKQLERLKLKVIRMPQEKFDHMSKWITDLGAAIGEPVKAKAVSHRWRMQIQKITIKTSKVKEIKSSQKRDLNRRAFIEVQDEPLVTIGGNSFLTDAFELIGYQNVFSNLTQSYPKISRESVLSANPNYIFVMDLRGREEEFVKAREGWLRFKTLKAVANDKILYLKGDDFGRCTFRLLNALEKLI